MEIRVDEPEYVRAVAELRHDATDAGGDLLEHPPEIGGDEFPALRRADPSVLHRVAEQRVPVPADPHEVRGRHPCVRVVVQSRHGGAQPAQMDGTR